MSEKKRASDSQLGQIYRQVSTLGRLAAEGKRDPQWVSRVLQDAIEHREDGSVAMEHKFIDLGMIEVDYDRPIDELLEPFYDSALYTSYYRDCTWAADSGKHQVHMGLVTFYLGHAVDPSTRLNGHQLREEICRLWLYDTQLPELFAAAEITQSRLADLGATQDVYALGPGITGRCESSDLPGLERVEEYIPKLSRIWEGNRKVQLSSWPIRITDDPTAWYLVRFGRASLSALETDD